MSIVIKNCKELGSLLSTCFILSVLSMLGDMGSPIYFVNVSFQKTSCITIYRTQNSISEFSSVLIRTVLLKIPNMPFKIDHTIF